MAMTETLAATAAQTIPVFALGGVVEARFAMQAARPLKEQQPSDKPVPPLIWAFLRVVWIVVLTLVATLDIVAEFLCLVFLGHSANSQSITYFIVILAMTSSLVLLVVLPMTAVIANARKRLQSTPIDPAELQRFTLRVLLVVQALYGMQRWDWKNKEAGDR